MSIEGTTTLVTSMFWSSAGQLRQIVVDTGEGKTYKFDAEERPLAVYQWEALQKAEMALYRMDPGCHGYTDVLDYSQSGELQMLWGTAANALENSEEDWERISGPARTMRVACRVARCLAVLNFGPEFLLR